jgi:hypothetical protein
MPPPDGHGPAGVQAVQSATKVAAQFPASKPVMGPLGFSILKNPSLSFAAH